MPAYETIEDLFSLFQQLLLSLDPPDATLTQAQGKTLHYLKRHPGCSVGEVAHCLGISNPAATKAIDRLVEKELVTRVENPGDRRTLIITLSEAGEAALAGFLGGRKEALDRILEKLRPEERRAFRRGLRAFMTAAFLDDHDRISKTCLHCGDDHREDCLVNQAHLALLETEIPSV